MWRLYDKNVRFVQPLQDLLQYEYGCDIYQNPLVPKVQQALDCADVESLRQSKGRISSRSSNIPLEVSILIAEWVCPIKHTLSDIRNTGNMLLVFGWNLPDWFWQRRLDEGLFIELDKLKKVMSPVGWQLRLNLMCLVVGRTEFRSSSGLASRERVLKSILALKKPYLNLESAKEKALIEKGKKNESQ